MLDIIHYLMFPALTPKRMRVEKKNILGHLRQIMMKIKRKVGRVKRVSFNTNSI